MRPCKTLERELKQEKSEDYDWWTCGMHHRIQSVSELFFVMFMYFAIIIYEP